MTPSDAGVPPVIARLEQQATLFAPRLNRFALLKLKASPPAEGPTLRVLRNHAFEGVASALPAFLDHAGVPMRAALGDYDDSLTLPEGSAEAWLVWLDFTRYPRLADEALADWAIGRLTALRAATHGPLIVANAPEPSLRYAALNARLADWAQATPGAAILPLDGLARELGEAFFDEARSAATGSRFSDAAAMATARTLAFELLADAFAPPLKALAVDLDNTLYEGVLGEDGAEGVRLGEGHAALQRAVADWAGRGVLVAVVSRNEPADVLSLFETRTDFPLRPQHIAAWQVGWGDKSAAVAAAAARFNIGADAFLMIDDNVGELAEAAARTPGLRLLYAGAEPAITANALAAYPGLPRGGDFAGRAADLAANAERQAMAREAFDETAYLAALKAELAFSLDPADDRARLAELSRKTNQFNLALARLDEQAVNDYLARPDACVVHIRLSDRLADSGSVAALFARREGDGRLIVDELCVSCRALGRKLEDLMVGEALRGAARALGARQVSLAYRVGPRNAPALDWAAAFAGVSLSGESGVVRLPDDRLDTLPAQPVGVSWT
ncbi:HAD-IIIC family phosphatase [Phenylobacterium sp. VNQ135]|uniref:HAD-IIIC family phosphatase n=1 Tax=Phenylobacterium sp. VNQ135 TaxID=3400922 RepID=UPI003C032A6A